MGRMWAVLYLSSGPLSAAELGERLSLSSGAVSMTLSELSRWGVVKKSWIPGERRDFYEPETDMWKMISRVFRERELRHVKESIEVFSSAITELQRASGQPDAPAGLPALVSRIEGLLQLARIGQHLLENILSGGPADPSSLKTFR
jgi:DNA-binding transcriptional regulator GbsR (MarR family)